VRVDESLGWSAGIASLELLTILNGAPRNLNPRLSPCEVLLILESS
jgi:hypothetical protein